MGVTPAKNKVSINRRLFGAASDETFSPNSTDGIDEIK